MAVHLSTAAIRRAVRRAQRAEAPWLEQSTCDIAREQEFLEETAGDRRLEHYGNTEPLADAMALVNQLSTQF
jgi:hypothetical protein